MKNFAKYLKALYEEFIALTTGGILAVAWFLASSFIPTFTAYQVWGAAVFLLIGLIAANYRAWMKIQATNAILESELKNLEENPVDYEIRSTLRRIDVHLEQELDWCNQEKEHANKQISNPRPRSLLESIAFRPIGPNTDDWHKYIQEIEGYEKEISETADIWRSTYQLHWDLMNVGIKYDEDITVKICVDDVDQERCELHDFLEQIAGGFPSKPSRPRGYDPLGSLSAYATGKGMSPLLFPANKYAPLYREVISADRHRYVVQLRSLKAKDFSSILYNGCYLLSGADEIRFNYEILSKNTKHPIVGSFILDLKNCKESFDPRVDDECE